MIYQANGIFRSLLSITDELRRMPASLCPLRFLRETGFFNFPIQKMFTVVQLTLTESASYVLFPIQTISCVSVFLWWNKYYDSQDFGILDRKVWNYIVCISGWVIFYFWRCFKMPWQTQNDRSNHIKESETGDRQIFYIPQTGFSISRVVECGCIHRCLLRHLWFKTIATYCR